MAAPVPLRSDFDTEALRALAKGLRDPALTRRRLALSVIAAGGARSEAAEIDGVGLQTVRDRVLAVNVDGPDEPVDGKAPGARPRLPADQRDALEALVEQGQGAKPDATCSPPSKATTIGCASTRLSGPSPQSKPNRKRANPPCPRNRGRINLLRLAQQIRRQARCDDRWQKQRAFHGGCVLDQDAVLSVVSNPLIPMIERVAARRCCFSSTTWPCAGHA